MIEDLELQDMMGNAIQSKHKGGRISLTLAEDPIYLRLHQPAAGQ